MSGSDVSQLNAEELPTGDFPASHAADFRVFFEQEVHAAISSHAAEDTSIEICGVVVGNWHKDSDGPFARITNFIRCDDAASKNTEVTFTHQSWSQINAEMDTKYADKRIIGWYHSHPNFGIFLSDRDMFIQEHFFSGAGQIAYVVDPVRKQEGVFEWRGGKAELMQRYWAGNQIISIEAANSDRTVKVPRSESAAAAAGGTASDRMPSEAEAPLSLMTMLLSALCLFLLGMLLGEWRTSKTQQYLAEGAIAHYGLWNVMQLGRSEQLALVHDKVSSSFDELTSLSEEQVRKFEGDEQTEVRKKFQAIRRTLSDVRGNLKEMESTYSVPPEQRELLAQVVVSHLAALSGFDTRTQLPVPVPIMLPDPELEEQRAANGAAPRSSKTAQPAGPSAADAGPGGFSDRTNMLPPPINPTGNSARK